jgi:hypothetical protein
MKPTGGVFRSGHLTEEGIGLYVDGLKLGKTEHLPQELLTHVAECAQCRGEIVELHQLLEDISYTKDSPHPFFDRMPAKRRRPIRIPYAIAAVILVAIGITYLVLRVGTKEERRVPEQPPGLTTLMRPETLQILRPEPRREPSVPQPMKPILAENFTPSLNLEDLVGTTVRSSGVEIVSPASGDTLTGPVRFAWNGTVSRILILSNTEQVIASADVSGSPFVLKDVLAPGLYYWKLEGNDELLAVGKFIVL